MKNYETPRIETIEVIIEDILMSSVTFGGDQAGDVIVDIWGL